MTSVTERLLFLDSGHYRVCSVHHPFFCIVWLTKMLSVSRDNPFVFFCVLTSTRLNAQRFLTSRASKNRSGGDWEETKTSSADEKYEVDQDEEVLDEVGTEESKDEEADPEFLTNLNLYQAGHSIEEVQSGLVYSFKFGVVSDEKEGAVRSVEDHDLTLTWSLETGKRTVTYDGTMVASLTRKEWNMCDSTVNVAVGGGRVELRVLACLETPLRATNDFRTGELLVGGRSIYDLPTLGQYGSLVPSTVRPAAEIDPDSGKKFVTSVAEVLCPDAMEWSPS